MNAIVFDEQQCQQAAQRCRQVMQTLESVKQILADPSLAALQAALPDRLMTVSMPGRQALTEVTEDVARLATRLGQICDVMVWLEYENNRLVDHLDLPHTDGHQPLSGLSHRSVARPAGLLGTQLQHEDWLTALALLLQSQTPDEKD